MAVPGCWGRRYSWSRQLQGRGDHARKWVTPREAETRFPQAHGKRAEREPGKQARAAIEGVGQAADSSPGDCHGIVCFVFIAWPWLGSGGLGARQFSSLGSHALGHSWVCSIAQTLPNPTPAARWVWLQCQGERVQLPQSHAWGRDGRGMKMASHLCVPGSLGHPGPCLAPSVS